MPTFRNTLFHLHRQVGAEKSAYKIETQGNYPKENLQQPEHGESLKAKAFLFSYVATFSTSQHSAECHNMCNLAAGVHHQIHFPKLNSNILYQQFSNFTLL
jgi:hypothetical protein